MIPRCVAFSTSLYMSVLSIPPWQTPMLILNASDVLRQLSLLMCRFFIIVQVLSYFNMVYPSEEVGLYDFIKGALTSRSTIYLFSLLSAKVLYKVYKLYKL